VKAGPSKTLLLRLVTPLPKPGPATKVVKMAWPKAKPRLRGTSEIELTLVKLLGYLKILPVGCSGLASCLEHDRGLRCSSSDLR
jgi:hypothetical protein